MKTYYYFFAILFLLSCNKEEAAPIILTNSTVNLEKITIFNELHVPTISAKLDYFGNELDFAKIEVDGEDFYSILRKLDIEIENPIFSISLFIEKNGNAISKENVKDVCIFFTDNTRAFLSYGSYNNFEFSEKIESMVSGVYMPTLKYLMFHQSQVSKNRVLVSIFNKSIRGDNILWQPETLLPIARKKEKEASVGKVLKRYKNCDPCVDDEEIDYCNIMTHMCEYTFDENCDRDDYLHGLVGEIGTDTLDQAYDDYEDVHYKLRDTIMVGNNTGIRYLSYYNTISEYTDNSISVSIGLKIDATMVLFNMNDNIEKLVFSGTTYDNDVFIGSSDSTRIVNVLNDFSDLSTDSRWTGMFSDIIDDVETYTNKTIGYIKSNI